MARGRLGRRRTRGGRDRERAPRPRRAQGRRVRDPRAHEPRVGALRLCARADRRGRGGDLREQLPPRLPLHPRALGGGRRPRRGRGAAREGRRPGPRPRDLVRGARRAARARPRVRSGAPRRARRSRSGRRRGGPLHVHLHLGHDRAAEGLHDPAPQLLRDDGLRRARRGLRRLGRHDAALPAARAQLRAADAPARRARGLHARVLPGPAPGRRGAARRPADAAAERAAPLREGAHGRARRVREGARTEEAAARLGAADRPRGQRCPAAGPRSCRSRSLFAAGSRTGSCSRR